LTTAAIAVALFGFGIATDLYFGRIGYMPFDQGIVFDGAWRLMNGQIPFRDFVAPNSIVPALMQVPFFRLLGVNWFAFVLHASVVNGLFSVASYALLRVCGATRLEAAFFGALGAFFFYPVNGTPFMDQHAFFFTTLMFAAVVIASRAPDDSARRWAWALVPAFFAAGYLSKQIPTSFAAISVAVWVVASPKRVRAAAVPLVVGAVSVAVSALALGIVFRVDWASAYQYLVVMPLGTGTERTTGHGVIAPIRLVLGTLRRLPSLVGLWSADIAIVFMLVMLIGARFRSEWRVRAWLLWSIALTTGAFAAYTVNQVQDTLALVMLAAGIVAVAARETVNRLPIDPRLRRRLAIGAVAIVAVASARDTWRFAVDVDMTRYVLDTQYNRERADAAEGHLPTALAFMRWTDVGTYNADDLTALVRYLQDAPGNFVLIGDSAPLYALTGKPSVNPALWFHPGLSVPRPQTAAFERFESQLLERFEPFDVRRVVVEGVHTLRGIALTDFPRLNALTMSDKCGERRFGLVRVIELCRGRRLESIAPSIDDGGSPPRS